MLIANYQSPSAQKRIKNPKSLRKEEECFIINDEKKVTIDKFISDFKEIKAILEKYGFTNQLIMREHTVYAKFTWINICVLNWSESYDDKLFKKAKREITKKFDNLYLTTTHWIDSHPIHENDGVILGDVLNWNSKIKDNTSKIVPLTRRVS